MSSPETFTLKKMELQLKFFNSWWRLADIEGVDGFVAFVSSFLVRKSFYCLVIMFFRSKSSCSVQ